MIIRWQHQNSVVQSILPGGLAPKPSGIFQAYSNRNCFVVLSSLQGKGLEERGRDYLSQVAHHQLFGQSKEISADRFYRLEFPFRDNRVFEDEYTQSCKELTDFRWVSLSQYLGRICNLFRENACLRLFEALIRARPWQAKPCES